MKSWIYLIVLASSASHAQIEIRHKPIHLNDRQLPPRLDVDPIALQTIEDTTFPTSGIRREPIHPFLRSTNPDALHEIPVVIVRYLPTADGKLIDVSKAADYWSLGPVPLPQLIRTIDALDLQIKFGLENGSRFRYYSNAQSKPSLSYRVVDYFTVFEQFPAGPVRKTIKGMPIYWPDYFKMLERINGRYYVESLGVKEFWFWTGSVDPDFPSYDPAIHKPENLRGGDESNMASPTTGNVSNSFRQNDMPIFSNTYTIYNQNFRRTTGEALHNHGHQLEAILSFQATRQDGRDALFWEQFVGRNAIGQFSTGRAGWTHIPPNTTKDYDYGINRTLVSSDIMDWTPLNTGLKSPVNSNTWQSVNYDWPEGVKPTQLDPWWYMFWWQSMPGRDNAIPHFSNLSVNRRTLSNWWLFTADWDSASLARVGLHEPIPAYTISQSSLNFSADGGSQSITISGSGGPWIATPNDISWITVTDRFGSAARSITVQTAPNSGFARAGFVTIAGQRISVSQSGRNGCTPTVDPPAWQISNGGGTISVAVTLPSGCSWRPVLSEPWLSIPLGATFQADTRSGSTILQLSAAKNDGPLRSGSMQIGQLTFSVRQAGAPPPPMISSVTDAASGSTRLATGSWLTIRGSNLSNVTRVWNAEDFLNGKLPTALSNVRLSYGFSSAGTRNPLIV